MSPAAGAQPGAPKPRLTADQQRAQWAWAHVAKEPLIEGYVGLVKAAPTLIMGSGLLQAIAFLSAKKGDEHKRLLTQLLAVLGNWSSAQQAIPDLAKMPTPKYRGVTEEAMARLRWLRHFADVMKER